MKNLATALLLLSCSVTLAHAADNGSAQLKFAGAAASEAFSPNRNVEMKDLGMLYGRDQFSVSWVMVVASTYPNADYKRFVFNVTAPKDGSAIQGLLMDFERGKEFAAYQPRCVLNSKEGCDIRAEGIDLDVKARSIRFTNARFVLKSAKPFPADVVVNGTLKY